MTKCTDADHQEKTKGGRDGMRSAAKKYGTEIYILSLVWGVGAKGEGEGEEGNDGRGKYGDRQESWNGVELMEYTELTLIRKTT